jgi:hypothetical protein
MGRHITSRTWTLEHLEELKALVKAGASPVRAAARLKRTIASVRTIAKQGGFPFPDQRYVKRDRLQRETDVRKELGLE